MKNLLLLAVIIVLGVVVLRYMGSRPGGTQVLTPEAAKIRLDSGDPIILLDVRTRAEYDEGHIPGAVCIPNEEINEEVSILLPDTHSEILVYCRSGRRSAEAAQKLVRLGYTRVYDFGGIIDWPYETTTE